jgi:hypothetical protein
MAGMPALEDQEGPTATQKGGTIMHPMFVKLYLETDTDEDEQDRRRRVARVRRQQARAVRVTASGSDRRPLR